MAMFNNQLKKAIKKCNNWLSWASTKCLPYITG